MKAHHENFQYIILGNTGLHTLETGDITAKSVLLGIIIDSKLDFKEDINNIIKKKTYYKLYTLRILRKFVT